MNMCKIYIVPHLSQKTVSWKTLKHLEAFESVEKRGRTRTRSSSFSFGEKLVELNVPALSLYFDVHVLRLFIDIICEKNGTDYFEYVAVTEVEQDVRK